MIACWRVKYDQAYWPAQHRHPTGRRGRQPRHDRRPAVDPVIADPADPDYPSGHACYTGALSNGLAHLFGADGIDFEVASTVTGTSRRFASAAALDEDAFNGRIWLGIHFRKAMTDGNQLGHDVSGWALDLSFQPVGRPGAGGARAEPDEPAAGAGRPGPGSGRGGLRRRLRQVHQLRGRPA